MGLSYPNHGVQSQEQAPDLSYKRRGREQVCVSAWHVSATVLRAVCIDPHFILTTTLKGISRFIPFYKKENWLRKWLGQSHIVSYKAKAWAKIEQSYLQIKKMNIYEKNMETKSKMSS